jgi:hypothetical protein
MSYTLGIIAGILFLIKYFIHGYMVSKVYKTDSWMISSGMPYRIWILMPIVQKFPEKYNTHQLIANICYYLSIAFLIASFFTQHLS